MSELLVRSKNGIKLYKFEQVGKNEKGEPKYTSKITFEYHGYIHEALWSVDGSCFLILHSVEGLLIIRNYEANRIVNKITCCSKYKDLFNSENVKLIKNVQWSPKNKFIVFFFPYDEQKHSQLGNLLLWSVTYNKVFYSFKIKKKVCSNWPIINFTSDDNYFFLLNKFDIYVYDALYLLNKSNNSLSLSCDARNSPQSDVPKDYVFSWSQSNVTALYISPYIDENHARYVIVHTKHNFLGGVFIYKIEGLHNYQSSQKLTNISYYQKGHNVINYDYIKSKNESANNSSNVFAFATNGVFNVITNKCEHPVEVKEIKIKLLEKKTFDNMDNLNCLWSASGKYVILLVQTNDTTNKSYGYLCNCFFFSLVATNFTLKKINEQIAQDVKWNKSEDEFLIIEGKSDNTITLYGSDLKAKCKFFSQYKNTIKWCPFGNMIAIGGFGNLAGDISFFYREKNDSVVLINEYREACTVLCDWSNDGMLFMTASTYPRMKVENVFKIYTYEGKLVSTSNFNELYDVRWKNCLNGIYREPPKPKVNLVDSKKNVYKLKTVNADKKDEAGSAVAAALEEPSTFRKNSKSEKEKEIDKAERDKDSNKEKNKSNKTGSPVIRKEKQQNSFDLDVNWRNKNNRVKKEGTEKEENKLDKEKKKEKRKSEENKLDKEKKKEKRKSEEKNLKKINEREQANMKTDMNWNDRRGMQEGIDEDKENQRVICGREMEQGDEEDQGERNLFRVIKELVSNKTNAQLGKNDMQIDMANVNDAEWERMFEMLEKSEEFKFMNGKRHEGTTRNGEFPKLDHRFGNAVKNGDDSFAKKDKFADMNHLDIIQMKRTGEGPFRIGNEVNEKISAEKGERKNGYSNIAPDFIPNCDTGEAGKMEEFSFLQQLQAMQALGANEKQEHNYNLHTPETQQTAYGEKTAPFLNYEQAQMKIEHNKNRNSNKNNTNDKNNNISNNDNERKEKRMTLGEYQEVVTKYNNAMAMCYKNATNGVNKEAVEARKEMAAGVGLKAGTTSTAGLATTNTNENNLSDLRVNNNENALPNEEYMKRIAQMINENYLNDKGMQFLNTHAMNNNAVNMNVLSKLCSNQKGNLNYLREYNASQNDSNKMTQMGRGKMGAMTHTYNGSTGTATDDSSFDNAISNNNTNHSNMNSSVNNANMSFVNQENALMEEEIKNGVSNMEVLKQGDMKKEEATGSGNEISSNEDIVNLFKKMLPHAKVNVVAQNGRGSPQSKKNWDIMKNGKVGSPHLNANQQMGTEYPQQMNFKREVHSNAYFDEQPVNASIRNKEGNPSMEMEKENYIREMLMKQRRLCTNMNNTGSNSPNINKAGRGNNTMNANNNIGASAMSNHDMRAGGGIQEEHMRLQMQAQTQAQMQPQMHSQMNNSNTNINTNINASTTDTKKQLNKLNFYELLKCYYTLNVQQIKIRLLWVNLKIENYGEMNKSKIPDSIEKEKSILCKLKEMGDMSEYISMLLKQFFISNREKYEDTLKEFSNVILYQDKVLYEKLNEMIRRHSDKPYIVSFIKNIDNIIEYYWSHNDEKNAATTDNSINNGSNNNNNINNNNNNNNNNGNNNNNNTNSNNNNNSNGGAPMNHAFAGKGTVSTNGKISPKDLNSPFGKKGNNTGNTNMNVNMKNMNNAPMNLNNITISNKSNMNNGNIRNGVKNGNKMINTPSMNNHSNNIMPNLNNIVGNANNSNNKTASNNMNMNQFEFQKRLLQQKRQVGNNFANSYPNEEQVGYLVNNGVTNYMPKGILSSKVDMLDEHKLALMYKMNLNDDDTNYVKNTLMNDADKHRIHLTNEHMHSDVTNCKNENFNRYDADSIGELSSLLHIRQAVEMEQNKKMEKEKTGHVVGRPDEALFAKKYILRDILKNKEQAKREASEGTACNNNNNGNGMNNSNTNNNTSTNANANNVKNVVNSHVVGEGYLDMDKLQQERVDPHFLKPNLQIASTELTAQLKNLLNVNMNAHNNSQLDAVATYANQINKMYQQTNYVNHMHQTEPGNEAFSPNPINTKTEVGKMGLSDINAKQAQINKQMLQVSNGELPNFKNDNSTAATSSGNTVSNRTHTAVNINNNASMFKAINISQNDIFSHPRDCNENSMGAGLYTRTVNGQNVLNNQMETEEANLRNDGNQERLIEDEKMVNESELREYVLNEKNKVDPKIMFLGANKENNNVINANHPLMLNKNANMNKKMNVDKINVDGSYDSSKHVNHIFEMRDTKRPDALRDKCWQYVDLKGVVQGPFYLEEMRVWNEMGFFEPMLPVRCCDMDRFVALNKLFPPPVKPFTTIPKPQPMLQWEEDIL